MIPFFIAHKETFQYHTMVCGRIFYVSIFFIIFLWVLIWWLVYHMFSIRHNTGNFVYHVPWSMLDYWYMSLRIIFLPSVLMKLTHLWKTHIHFIIVCVLVSVSTPCVQLLHVIVWCRTCFICYFLFITSNQ